MIGQLVLKHLINGARNSLASRGRRFLSIFLPAVILTALLGTPSYATPTWTQTDFSTGATGTLSIASGTYTIAGAGSGIATSGTTDSFSFVSTPAAGNTEIVAQVSSQTNTSAYAVAGLMVRDSLAANGAGAVIGVSPSNGINFTSRLTDGATSNTTLGPSIAAPVYLRLVRSGTSLAGYQSSDGINWTQVGTCTITLPSTYYIGFAVSSNVYGTLSTAAFTNVSYMANVPQRSSNLSLWLRSDVGVTYNGSNQISQWADQSGNGNNAFQSTTANKPTVVTNAINGLPAVGFNGTSQSMQFGSGFANFSSGASIFMVMKPSTLNSGSPNVMDFGNGGTSNDLAIYQISSTQMQLNVFNGSSNSYLQTSGVTLNQSQVFEAIHNGAGTATIYINGTQQAQGSVNNLNNITRANNYLGQYPGGGYFYEGQIAEILVYNSPLSTTQRAAVENYFYSKYGLGSQATLDAPVINSGVGVVSSSSQPIAITSDSGAPIYYTTNGTTPTTSSTLYSGPIYISTSTTIKAIAAQPFFNTSSVSSLYIQLDPNASSVTLNGLVMWLKADNSVTTSGSNVTQWADVSGNGNNATQSNSSYQPTLVTNAINSLPAVNLNGTSQFMQFGSGFANFTSGASIFLIAKPTALNSGSPDVLDFGNGGNSNDLAFFELPSTQIQLNVLSGSSVSDVNSSSGLTLNQYQLWEAIHNGAGTATLYTNGVQGGQNTSMYNITNINRTSNYLGQYPTGGYYYQGQIAEILVYNRPLSTSERASLEAYVYARYGIGNQPAVSAPVISPSNSVFSSGPQAVTITASSGTQIYYTTDGTTPTTGSTLYTVPFSVSTSTTVKAIAAEQYFANSQVTTSIIQIEPTTAAVTRTNLLLWLKADNGVSTSGSNVTQWTDLSGSGNNATQSSSGSQPTLVSNAVNNLPAVSFNGSSQYMQFGSGFANFTSGASIFMAIQPSTLNFSSPDVLDFGNGGTSNDLAIYQISSTQMQITAFNGSSNTNLQSSGVTLNVPQLFEAIHNGAGTATIYINGTQKAQGSVNNLNNITRANNYLGRYPGGSYFFQGQLAEILVYNAGLTASQRAAVEGYLISKYQLLPQSVPAPIISVAGGTLSGPTQVAITAQNGCTIYVTQDGTTPTTSSPQYSGPINVYYSETVKAIAVNSAGISSSVSSASYTLNSGQWPAPASGGPSLQINLQQPTNAVPQ